MQRPDACGAMPPAPPSTISWTTNLYALGNNILDVRGLAAGTQFVVLVISWIFERRRPGHDDPDVPDLAVEVENDVISISGALLGGPQIGRCGLGLCSFELPSRRPPISGTIARRTPEPVEAMVQDHETKGARTFALQPSRERGGLLPRCLRRRPGNRVAEMGPECARFPGPLNVAG